ncbi:MAG: sulfite exporter TauE/SafE family protein [Planctomycetes bacterium]|nr:sulfite exporter TauE/SafE family protein [Planctomycetota bacterium]
MEHGSLFLLALIAVVSFLLSFIGATVGLVLGHLRLPLLIAYLGSPGAGAAMNLVISGTGALSGAYRHIRDGRISWVALALMGIPSVVGAIIAINIFVQINPLWSYLVIGIVLVISGVKMIYKKEPTIPPGEIPIVRRIIIEIILGLGLGALAAITGLMLGSLRLPMMIRYLRMDPKQAIGTNMAVGCLTGLIGAAAAFHAGAGKLNMLVLCVVIPPTLIGGYIGGWLTGKFSKDAIQRLAGWIVAVTGVLMIGQGSMRSYKRPPQQLPPVLIYEDADNEFKGEFEYVPAEPDLVMEESDEEDAKSLISEPSE